MRNVKKTLSMLTALAMTASAFSGLCISASAEDIELTATLAHTASAQGGSNAAGTYLDAENHYYNNWGEAGWAATAYSDFTFNSEELPSDSSKILSATLTTQINCGRGTRGVDIGYVPTSTVNLTGETAADCTIPMIAKSQATILASFSDVSTTYKEYTIDATAAVKAMIENGENEVVFAYSNGAAGGNIYGKGASEELRPKLVVKVADPNAVFHKVTVKTTCDGEELSANDYDVKDGDPFTPNVENTFNKDGYKYTIESGNDTIESVTEDTVIEIKYTKRELIKTNATVTAKSGNTDLGVVSSYELTEDSKSYVCYPKYILKDGKLYATEQGPSSGYYSKELTGTEADQNVDVEYAEQTDAKALYYVEGENLGEDSKVANSTIRCSGGAAYKVPTEGVEVAKLSAGTYTIESAVWGTNDVDYTFTAGDNEVFKQTTTGSLVTGSSESFTVTEDTTLKVASSVLKDSGLDYVLIKGEGTVTPIGGETPSETEKPSETEAPSETAVPTDSPAPTNTPEPIENKVYISEDFDSYEVGEIIKSAGNDVDAAYAPVTKGQITYAAGRRNNGPLNDSASIEGDETNKTLSISEDGYSTSGRGISFTFAEDAKIPTADKLGDNQILELSMDITANQKFTLTGFGDITTDNIGTGTHLRAIIDKGANKQYIISTDAEGNVVASSSADLTATSFTGASFYFGTGSFTIDNLKVETKTKDVGIVNVSVKNGEEALSDADVTIGNVKTKTNANGTASAALPNGTYTVTASKSGYEHTQGLGNADTVTVTVEGNTVNADMTLSPMTYVKLPDTVEVEGGQVFIAAPKEDDTATTSAFTVKVLDQYDIPMASNEYGLDWSIHPSGTDTVDSNVTIDENGVVSVAKTFTTDSKVAAYDVTAVVTCEDRNQKVTKTLYVANNDIISYDPLNWSQGGGTGNRGGEIKLANSIELPDVTSVSFNVNFPTGTDGQVTLGLISNAGALAGIQYTSDGAIKAWSGWSGNSAYNQSGDAGAYAQGGVIAEGYTKGTVVPVTLVIDKANKNITASSGSNTVSIPYTIDASALTGFKFGQYRNYGAITVSDVLIQEPNSNYLSVNGETSFAKVAGQTLTKQYSVGQSVIVPDETFKWTLSKDGKVIEGSDTSAELNEDVKYTAVFNPTKTGKATVLKAVFDANGRLVSVKNDGTIDVTAGTEVKVDTEQGTKVMLWDGTSTLEPLANAAEAKPEETTAPTEKPDETTAPTDKPDETPAPTDEPIHNDSIWIDQDGVLSVTDKAEPGTYTITATSTINAEKTASLDVTITDFEKLDVKNIEVEGPRAYDINGEKTGKYSISRAVDSYGTDIASLLTDVKWTVDNDKVASITEDGTLTVAGAGNALVTGTITNGTSVTTVTVPVTVAAYSVTAAATGNSTSVDTSALIKNNNIVGYQVTTAKSGKLVKQSIETAAPSTVDTTGADSVEITPVFEYAVGAPGTLGNLGAGYEIAIPSGTYNFNVKDTGSRCDVYVNDQMLVNNILQGGSAVNNLDVKDIIVNEGVANITTADYSSGQNETSVNITIKVSKAPSNVDRAKKIYVLGDSLVCIYYNGGNASNNAQTGWGQVLQSYVKDADVVDLGNSGVTAKGLAGTAFTQVLRSAQPGDIMILESGYNDRTYDNEKIMTEAVTTMYNGAKDKGVDVVLVSPNASVHDYKASVAFTSTMTAAAESLGANYINLSKLSYDFLYGTYADDTATILATYNVSDKLHSTYHAANKWASVIASELIGFGYGDNVNTDYAYTFKDTKGTEIKCQATAE